MRPALLAAALVLVPLPALASEPPQPLIRGDSFTARGLIVCTDAADAELVATALNTAPRTAAEIDTRDPAFGTLSRLMYEGRCTQFDAWLEFTPQSLVHDGARQQSEGVAFHVVAADFTMAEGPKRLFLLTERPFRTSRR